MSLLCVIPARGGSKGLKKKNMAPLLGKPLISYTIEFLLQEKQKGDVVVTTDSQEIAEVCSAYPVEVIKRPKAMAKDSSPLQVAWYHALFTKEKQGSFYELTALFEPTCPIRQRGILEKAVRKMKREHLDAIVTVREIVAERPEFLKVVQNGILRPYKTSTVQRRQALKGKYVCLDGSMLLVKTEILKRYIHRVQTHGYLGKKVGFLLQTFPFTLDIDTRKDLRLCELVLKHWQWIQ